MNKYCGELLNFFLVFGMKIMDTLTSITCHNKNSPNVLVDKKTDYVIWLNIIWLQKQSCIPWKIYKFGKELCNIEEFIWKIFAKNRNELCYMWNISNENG